MANEIWAAAIGAAGTIAAAAVGLAGVRWSHRTSKGVSDLLVGTWDCTWNVEHPTAGDAISDRVTIDSVSAGRIRGSGNNTRYGKYDLVGTEARFAATLSYRGEHDKAHLVGVAILVLEGTGTRLSGVWWQYSEGGSLTGGKVVWKKL